MKINSVETASHLFYVSTVHPSGDRSYDKITETFKNGVLWYQCWLHGRLLREINSNLVESVEYNHED